MVINRLENFKFRQYLSNIISRLIYMVIEINCSFFSDMNISTKRLYSYTKYPTDTIKFYLKVFFVVKRIFI